MRTYTEIIESIRSELSTQNSKLSQFSQYSNLYLIFRAIAKVLLENEAYIEEQNDNKYLENITGIDLDIKGNEYDLIRNAVGTKAVGSILVNSNSSVQVANGTIITEIESGTQFEIIGDVITTSIESPITVVSVDNKEINVPAGKILRSSLYPNVNFVIGTNRNIFTNQIEGDLVGGSNPETDDEFRLRILNRSEPSYISTEQGILSRIEELDSISKLYIVNNKPITGYFTIYIDNNQESVLEEVIDIVETSKAAGVKYIISPINYIDFNLNLEIILSNSANISETETRIRELINIYINNLNIGENIVLNNLLGIVYSVEGVIRAQVIDSAVVEQIQSDEQLRLNTLSFVFSRQ